MADALVKDLLKKYYDPFENRKKVDIKDEYFDNLVLLELDTVKEVVASKGNTVIYLRYDGYADFINIIEEIKKVL